MKLSYFTLAFSSIKATEVTINQKFKSAALETLTLGLRSSDQIDLVLSNGCWCQKLNTRKNLFDEFGPSFGAGELGGAPINDLDEICKSWINSRKCNEMYDGGKCFQQNIDDWTYQIDQNNFPNLCNSNTDKCKLSTCEIDIYFVEEIRNFLLNNPTFESINSDNCQSKFNANLGEKICTGDAPDKLIIKNAPKTTTQVPTTVDEGGLPGLVDLGIFVPQQNPITFIDGPNGKRYVNPESVPQPTDEVIDEICNANKFDLTVLIDGSGSVAPDNYEKSINFVRSLVHSLDVSTDATRVTLAQFSYYTKFYSLISNSESTLDSTLDYMINDQYQHATYTNVALYSMLTVMKNYGRSVPQILLVITDGQSTVGMNLQDNNGQEYSTAQAMHDSNVQVFTVGVGSQTSTDELEEMASDPDTDYLYEIENFNILDKIRRKINFDVCSKNKENSRMGRSMNTIGGSDKKTITQSALPIEYGPEHENGEELDENEMPLDD